MAGSQIATSVSILNSLLGFQAISLTNFATSSLSAIAAGSKVEIAGAFFNFASEEAINASSWTAITTATTAFLALTPSGAAGSQTVSAAWISTTPVWSTSKQGYYASAGSSIRIIGSVYKLSSTQQSYKTIYGKESDSLIGILPPGPTAIAGDFLIPGAGFLSVGSNHANTNATSYTLISTIKSPVNGTVRVKTRCGVSLVTAYWRVYKNGVAVGTAHVATATTSFYNDDISVNIGDSIELYGYVSDPSYNIAVYSFGVCSDQLGYSITGLI